MAPIPEPLFYHSAAAAEGDLVLVGPEAHHVSVQRLRRGDAIALFDGRGTLARGRIAALGRTEVRVEIARREHAPPPAPRIDLYSAIPKGDRQAVLLEMATQLGISRFVPVRWQRSVVEAGERARERWLRVCIEACKQSRRAYVPELSPPVGLEEAIAGARAEGARLVLAHPSEDAVPLGSLDVERTARYALFIGPEGGLVDDEVKRLRDCGAAIVRLSDAILRIEAAAVALIASLCTLSDRGKTPEAGQA
ncbi:MAG TPA: RsmE family RNA methyltransferase [Burkholderiales bacterium]